MAYFDSPKNKALWERELSGLREERDRRAKGITSPIKESEKKTPNMQKAKEKPVRVRTSYAELLKEEMASVKKAKSVRQRSVQKKDITKTTQVQKTTAVKKAGRSGPSL